MLGAGKVRVYIWFKNIEQNIAKIINDDVLSPFYLNFNLCVTDFVNRLPLVGGA